ncbi:hypothetical protein SCUCBS95973_001086 [Sporothrix curviconia]|uniref:MYND-type domain-containing protein n=1 Tax=Sporothrix curviconia TaxID=1260050 RepID=A0ABP0AVS6_9PEZI
MIPDLGDRSLFPPFLELPEDNGASSSSSSSSSATPADSNAVLLAQIKDNMTITKPTLVLTDRDGHGFALVFDGLDRDGLDLGKLGLKKGATAVVRGARQTVPAARSNEQSAQPETLTAKAARRQFLRIAPGQAHTVQAVPTGLEQTIAIAATLRAQQTRTLAEGCSHCAACGVSGSPGAAGAAAAAGAAETQGLSIKKLLRCTGCGQAWYCDRACQTKGWSNGHKSECKALKALSAIWSE